MTASDLWAALHPVVEALGALEVRYYIGGSVASSTHGVPRASIDADLVAELGEAHIAPLLARLGDLYYADERRGREAVRRRGSFNVIHLATMFKVDIFVSPDRPFDREVLARAERQELAPGGSYRVATAEDTILLKLEWYRKGGEVSERQWGDIAGILATSGSTLDRDYLRKWADALEVRDLLDQAERV